MVRGMSVLVGMPDHARSEILVPAEVTELGAFAYVLAAGENALNALFFVYGNLIPARCR